MSEDNYWTQPGTIITILCIAAAFAGALFCAYRGGKQRTAQMQEFAEKHGWGFSRNDTEKLGTTVETYFPRQRFNLSMITTIETGDRSIRLFDCSHYYYDRKDSGRFGTGCIIESPRFRTNGAGRDIVEILEGDGSGIAKVLLPGQVDIGDPEFATSFTVISKNRIAARNVITSSLKTVLRDHREAPLANPVSVTINATGSVVLTGNDASPERMLDLIELCRKIETSMP